jgi:hypothetical protein
MILAVNRRYAAPVFLGAFLLFALQPMAGKRILPRFGGGPAVWTTCMLLFQVLLLAGYAYAHLIATRLSPRLQRRLHVGALLLSAPFLWVLLQQQTWNSAPATASDPVMAILRLLVVAIGFPYLMLASTGPLMQAWVMQSWAPRGGSSPYRLYAVSNGASFLALLSYPVAVEPWISVQHQFWIWSAGYAVYIAVTLWCAAQPIHAERQQEAQRAAALPDLLRWLALAACGSTMLLAVTNQMCQEVAVIPFLWILPLALYLLTFTACFDHPRWYDRAWWGLALAILTPVACALLAISSNIAVWPHILVDTLTLIAACMVCHGELAASKPDPARLTYFYLAISAGGALGGVFVAVIAPRVFTDFTEFPLALAGACLLALDVWRRSGVVRHFAEQPMLTRSVVAGLAMAALLGVYLAYEAGDSRDLAAVRNFYGILRVTQKGDPPWVRRLLTHGRTVHGFQYQDDVKRLWPVSYYGAHSGLGLVMEFHPRRFEGGRTLRVGVIGLGTGTVAAYGHAGDTIRYYEINPAVDRISNDYFTFRKDSKARVEVVSGDARLQLDVEGPQHYDVLAVDAFTSDAIPAHLLTAECAALYRRHLNDDGVLLFHISNRTLDLAPVVRAIAARLGWRAGRVASSPDTRYGVIQATWVIVSGNEMLWRAPVIQQAVDPWSDTDRRPLEWTDDFTSLWRVLKF